MASKRRISAAALAVLLLLPLTLPASASPTDDARARAVLIARERERITSEAERVNERRLATVVEIAQLAHDENDLEVHLAATGQSMRSSPSERLRRSICGASSIR